jgi:hypothetical protein
MKREFTKFIKTLDEDSLAKELQKLYNKFPEIKKYYQMELSPTTDKVVNEYKVKLRKEYFRPTSLGRGKSSVSRKLIAGFKKIAIHQSDVIELWVYRTELMAEYTMKRNYIKEAFSNSLVSSYETSCKLIVKERLEIQFAPRCKTIIDTIQDYGWGLPEELEYIYKQYFRNLE